MRKFVIAAALATAAVSAPAAARDGAPYVGVEGGPMVVQDMNFKIDRNGVRSNEVYELDYNTGFDVDAIAGYDFGMFRAEGEIAYKRASANSVYFDIADYDADGRSTVLSAMLNGLLDFGGEGSWRGYVGLGGGLAKVKTNFTNSTGSIDLDGSDSGFAWQMVAGVGIPISDNIELGLKYRYFTAPKVRYSDDSALVCGTSTSALCTQDIGLKSRFRSHSLLASLVYNFWTPPVVEVAPPPPPPPPPPPATQTCPDGSVILATEVCPAPPPPPPPPPPAPERG